MPGYYLLFVVSEDGVPSHARIVHLDYGDQRRADHNLGIGASGL